MSDSDTISHIPAPLADALTARGYSDLTPVQVAVSDPELGERDLLVSAQTGSGKTVAFGLTMAPALLEDRDRLTAPDLPMALIIAPTRELALQVRRELEWLYEKAGAVITSCVGGMDMRNERRALERGAHIVVGTPGRLRDHLERGSLDPSALRTIVLDEADEMLDLGFREDLEFILSGAPEDRRTLMFSATVSKPIAELAKNFQRDAKRISTVAEREQHLDIEYRALNVDTSDRENAIVNVLRFYEAQTSIVFCSTRAAVSHLTSRFLNRGFSVVALSGELSQQERSHALQSLRDGRARVCIATDVAARGIDLPGLDLVIHADLPTNKETLLHRSGRTGRAGRKGVSALIVPNAARKKAERLLHFANVTASWGPAPSADEIRGRDVQRMLTDPMLTQPAAEDEAEGVALLTSSFTAEALAAAFLRLTMAGRSAPEELREVGERSRRDHTAFDDAQWFALSVGHESRAEARWLLPMLCRNGGITRADIGAIRVGETETYVQIAAHAAKGFASNVGGELEDGIRVSSASADAPGTAGAPASTQRRRPEKMPRAERSKRPEGNWSPEEGSDARPAKYVKAERPARKAEETGFVSKARPRDEGDFGAKRKAPAKPFAKGAEGRFAKAEGRFDKGEGRFAKPGKPSDDRPRGGKPFKAEGKSGYPKGGKPAAKPAGKPRRKDG